MQAMYAVIGGAVRCIELPPPNEFVLPGIRWGRFDVLFTPAFWRGQSWQHEQLGTYKRFQLGRSLIEETAACLLGGFGMKAELGLAAFARLRDGGFLETRTTAKTIEKLLAEPFLLNGSSRQYRFPRQKSRYLASCLERFQHFSEPEDDLALRAELSQLPGIGPKTASWIVRNYRGSNAVAIIDVHIWRAGLLAGIFSPSRNPQAHYDQLERRFLRFAAAIKTQAAMLDALMWDYMRRVPTLARARPRRS